PRAGFHDLAHRCDAGAVPFDSRQIARARPAAVPIHDHCHVAGEALEIDLLEERLFDGSRLRELAQIDHRVSDVSTQCPKASNLLPAQSSALLVMPAPTRARVPTAPICRCRFRSALLRSAYPCTSENRPG